MSTSRPGSGQGVPESRRLTPCIREVSERTLGGDGSSSTSIRRDRSLRHQPSQAETLTGVKLSVDKVWLRNDVPGMATGSRAPALSAGNDSTSTVPKGKINKVKIKIMMSVLQRRTLSGVVALVLLVAGTAAVDSGYGTDASSAPRILLVFPPSEPGAAG